MALGNSVTERIQVVLSERRLGPGARIPPERELAVELGIARSSLREGLRRLVDLGVLEARRGSGTYLAQVDLQDLLEVRLRLEPYAARLAAARRVDRGMDRLLAALGDLRAHLEDPEGFAAADARLHAAVTAASGSVAMSVLLDAMADMLRHSRAATAPSAALRRSVLVRHEQLVRAIEAGDEDAAERAMEMHLREVGAAAAQQGDPAPRARVPRV